MEDKDWLRNVPQKVKDEVEEAGLKITGMWGGEESPCSVSCMFTQKGNQKLIKLLESYGWFKWCGQVSGGVKYVTYQRSF